jgi:hypothetical protein
MICGVFEYKGMTTVAVGEDFIKRMTSGSCILLLQICIESIIIGISDTIYRFTSVILHYD